MLLALSSLVVLVYSYYFAVRREHVHDLRGSQLCGSCDLADRVFTNTWLPSARFKALLDFVHLHPTASARRRVILRRDFVLLSFVLYPLIVAGAQPLALLLMTGWHDVFVIDRHWWNLAITTATGVILYLVLCADIARLALDALLHRTFLMKIALYAAAAGAATQIPRFILEFVFGVRKGGFIVDGIALSSLVVMIGIVSLPLMNRCPACGRRRAGALLLRTACECQHEHLPLLRRWSAHPYNEHLSASTELGPGGAEAAPHKSATL